MKLRFIYMFKTLLKTKYKIAALLSQTLFHKTNESSAIKILKENKFRLSTWLGGSGVDKGSDKLWFLSTSTRPGAYRKNSSGVILVLDGAALNLQYEGNPFDYWGAKFHEASNSDTDEAEERIYSDVPTIPASQYIKEIHADWFIHNNGYNAQAYKRHRELNLLARRLNIPIYWYENSKSLDTLDKSRTKKFSEFPAGPKMTAEELADEDKYGDRISSYFVSKWTALLSIEPAKTKADLPKNIWKYISSYSDGHSGFAADIHNASKNMVRNSSEMRYIYKVQKQMERVGAKDFKDFYQKMLDKLFKLNS